jgi:hypothetical protein
MKVLVGRDRWGCDKVEKEKAASTKSRRKFLTLEVDGYVGLLVGRVLMGSLFSIFRFLIST